MGAEPEGLAGETVAPPAGHAPSARSAIRADIDSWRTMPSSGPVRRSSVIPPAPTLQGAPPPSDDRTLPGPAGVPPSGPLPDQVHVVAPAELRHACEALREDVAGLALPLDVPGALAARSELNSLITQLDDYLLPRLRRIDAPLLAVVGGSTGAGKSTLVNSLVRRFVTRSGVLRPTTRSPVLVHHPYDSGAFLTQRILPGFARVTSEAPEPLQPIDVNAPRVTALRLVPHEGLAPGLAIIDAPDIDSLVETNRDLAVQLLAAADLWIFVTTAARYSDAVPWEMLRTAVDRGVAVAVVLDRVPVEGMNEVRVHLATLLRDRGLATAPLFTIAETTKDADGFLPEAAVATLRGWLTRLARDARSRDVVVRRTLVGVLDSLRNRVDVLASAAEAQQSARAELDDVLTATFDEARDHLAAVLGNGSLLRGEVLARWQDLVGSGELVRGLDGPLGRLRVRLSTAFHGPRTPAAPLAAALRTGVEAAVATVGRGAVERTARGWSARPGGPSLIVAADGGGGEGLRVTPGYDDRLAGAVAEWQVGLADLVREEPLSVRVAGFGVEGTAAVLGLVAVANDVPDDEPTVALVRHVLDAVLGDRAGSLAVRAQADLRRRANDLLTSEQVRFAELLDAAKVRPDLPSTLRAHLDAIERAR